MRTNCFCTNVLNTPRGPAHPGKIPGTSQIPLFETQGRQTFEGGHEVFGHHPFAWNLVAQAIRNVIRANRFAIDTPIFIGRQADSHESLEFPIRENHPIRANRANRFARTTPLRGRPPPPHWTVSRPTKL